MREIVFQMSDLTDSRELLSKRIPPATTIFISIVILVLVVGLIWAYFGKMETYVKSIGEIRPVTVYTLTTIAGGKVKEKYVTGGETVHAGDKLLEFDSAAAGEQKQALEKQIADLDYKIECCDKLLECIDQNKNLFDKSSDKESQYYYRYENYRLEVKGLSGSQKDLVKAGFITSVNETKDTHIMQRDSLKPELIEAEKAVGELAVTASHDGVIEWAGSFQVGDVLAPGAALGTVTPAGQELQVILFVAEEDVAAIEVGQEVEYTISSISGKKTEKVFGRVTKISEDITVSESGEQNGEAAARFYRAEATLFSDQIAVKGKRETAQLRPGMSVEAHVISGDQRILEWLLNKLGFLEESFGS